MSEFFKATHFDSSTPFDVIDLFVGPTELQEVGFLSQ